MSSSNCCYLTCIETSQEAGQVVWYSHLFRIFQFVVIHTAKGFGIVNKAEVDVFLEFSCFFWDPTDHNLISSSSAFSKSSLYIWKFLFQVTLKPGLENVKHYLLACEMSAVVCSLNIPWNCLSLGFKWRLTFSSPVAIAEFSKFASILSAALSLHYLLGFETAQLEFHHLH